MGVRLPHWAPSFFQVIKFLNLFQKMVSFKKSKFFFFIDNFVFKFLITFPYIIYHIFLSYLDRFKWFPYLIFVAIFFIGIVTQLIQFKFDKTFFRNPIDVFWDRNLSDYKKLFELEFKFDSKGIGKADLYFMTGLLTVLPAIGSMGSMIINYTYDRPIIQPMTFFFFLITPTFGLILFFIAYLPAWKLFRKYKEEGNSKPYWYCFSYHMHYSRQYHYFKQNTSKIKKPNTITFVFCCMATLMLGFDLLSNSRYLIDLYSTYASAKNYFTVFNAMKFFEFVFLALASSQIWKFLYLDNLKLDALKTD